MILREDIMKFHKVENSSCSNKYFFYLFKRKVFHLFKEWFLIICIPESCLIMLTIGIESLGDCKFK